MSIQLNRFDGDFEDINLNEYAYALPLTQIIKHGLEHALKLYANPNVSQHPTEDNPKPIKFAYHTKISDDKKTAEVIPSYKLSLPPQVSPDKNENEIPQDIIDNMTVKVDACIFENGEVSFYLKSYDSKVSVKIRFIIIKNGCNDKPFAAQSVEDIVSNCDLIRITATINGVEPKTPCTYIEALFKTKDSVSSISITKGQVPIEDIFKYSTSRIYTIKNTPTNSYDDFIGIMTTMINTEANTDNETFMGLYCAPVQKKYHIVDNTDPDCTQLSTAPDSNTASDNTAPDIAPADSDTHQD